MTGAHASTPHHDPAGGPRDQGVDVRAVLGFGAGLVVTALVLHALVWLLFAYFDRREATRVAPAYPLAIGREDRLPPEPRLQPNPRGDLQALRAQEEALLTTYGWVDRPAGVVRIPIEEAIRITAQRGLPSRQGTRTP